MKRLLPFLVLAVLATAGCGGGADGGSDVDSTSGDAVITIEGSAFGGDSSVPKGGTVTVRNEDDTQHTFTPDEAGAFEAATLDGGKSAEVEMGEPGTYGYHCAIHTSMTGSITVEP